MRGAAARSSGQGGLPGKKAPIVSTMQGQTKRRQLSLAENCAGANLRVPLKFFSYGGLSNIALSP